MKNFAPFCLSLFFCSTLLLACENATSNNKDKTTATQEATNSKNNCFEQYVGKPELLLTADLVGQFVDFEGQTPSAEKTENPFKKSTTIADENATVNCQWKINRKRRIIRLQQIKKIKLYKSKTAVDRFYDKYHTRSESEKTTQKETYTKEVVDKVEDQNAKEISDKIIDLDYKYLKIDKVGDAAVWEHKVNNLLVLVGDYQFTVNAKLTKGNENDLEKAIAIAKAIIKKACN